MTKRNRKVLGMGPEFVESLQEEQARERARLAMGPKFADELQKRERARAAAKRAAAKRSDSVGAELNLSTLDGATENPMAGVLRTISRGKDLGGVRRTLFRGR